MSTKRTPDEEALLYNQLNDLLAGLIGLDEKLEPVVSGATIVITNEQADYLGLLGELEEVPTNQGVLIQGTDLYDALKALEQGKASKVKAKKPKQAETTSTEPPTE